MRWLIFFAALSLATLATAQQAPAPSAAEIRALVKQLGSEEYTEREAAEKQLNAIGEPALNELRTAARSQNPEVVRRARAIVARIERRIDNEKTLEPTLVELDVRDKRLDDVLADLSKQARYDVVLGGLKQAELADRRITLSTGGKVPFWTAMLRVCDAADLQLAANSGFLAPDAMPYLGRAPRGVRVATNTANAIVLEARGEAKRRPAAVHGAVLVEAIPFPKATRPSTPTILLQVWPEPGLQWRAVSGLKFSTAIDAAGTRLVVDTSPLVAVPRKAAGMEGMIIIRNADGTARIVDGSRPEIAGRGWPNARQALVRFKDQPAGTVNELGVSLFGTVRSGVEPLVQATGLEANKSITGTGIPGVDLTVRYSKDETGRLIATVNLSYERARVQHAGIDSLLPGVRGAGPAIGNQTVHGVRITDADGKPFTLGYLGGTGRSGGTREVMSLTLELHPSKDGNGSPATVTFWGTYAKPVEVPVRLHDVPLGGK